MLTNYEVWLVDEFEKPNTYIGKTLSFTMANILAEQYVMKHPGSTVGIGYTTKRTNGQVIWTDHVIWE